MKPFKDSIARLVCTGRLIAGNPIKARIEEFRDCARSNGVLVTLLLLALLIAGGSAVLLRTRSVSAQGAWHPVRVKRDSSGRAHYFEVWNNRTGVYENKVLFGYENIAFAEPDGVILDRLNRLASHRVNFIRLWLRPSDGCYAYWYNPARSQVDLDQPNPEFFNRLDQIIGWAEARGIVLEVMLWDRTTGWVGGGLPPFAGCDECSGPENCPDVNPDDMLCHNVHHQDNHYRSSAGNQPIPNLKPERECRIGDDRWYNTSNAVWMDYQLRYTDLVVDVLRRHSNVTLELINEAPRNTATEWRKEMHRQIRARYPDIALQSEAVGFSWNNDPLISWGATADGRGKVDMISSHEAWNFDRAETVYRASDGFVLPGCNEFSFGFGNIQDCQAKLDGVRMMMWGLTMGGGAAYIEDIGPLIDAQVCGIPVGGTITDEMDRFFHVPDNRPRFWEMRPDRTAIPAADNPGTFKYSLVRSDNQEFLIFVTREGTLQPFHVNGTGNYEYRWFRADGANSSWTAWANGNSWLFTPPGLNYGLQIRTTVSGSSCPVTAPVPGPPSGVITNPRPTFSWSAVAGAGTYTLYVQRVSDGSVVLREININGTSFTPRPDQALPTGIDLRWKVKGEKEGCLAGPYSVIVFFRVN